MPVDYERSTGSYEFPAAGETSQETQEKLEDRVKDLEGKVTYLEHGMRTLFGKWYQSKVFGLYFSEIDKLSFLIPSYSTKKAPLDLPIKLTPKPLEAREIGVRQFFSIGPYFLLGRGLWQNFWFKAFVGMLLAIFGPWSPCLQAYIIISLITIAIGFMAFLITKNTFYFKDFIRLVTLQPVLFFLIALGHQMDVISPIKFEQPAILPFRAVFMVFFAFFNISCCVTLTNIMGLPFPESIKKFTQKVRDFLQT